MSAVLPLLMAAAALAAEPALTVDLDPRLELDGAARLLTATASPDPGFIASDIPYARQALALLEAYRGHDAVRLASRPPLDKLSFVDRGQILLRLSPLPDLNGLDAVPYSLRDKAGGARALEAWIASLRALAKDSRFEKNFSRLRPLLEPELKEFRARLAEKRFVETIEEYCGLPFPGIHRVHLSPFHAAGGVANVVTPRQDGSVTVDSIIGAEPRGKTGVTFWSKRVPSILWHELAHGVVDPLGDLYSERIALSSASFAPIAALCYGDWRQCVKEHAVRAVMIRLLARSYGEDWGEEQLAWEGRKKYPYLEAMTRQLKEYEKDRARWPTLADFYPRLLSALPEPPAARETGPSLADLPSADEAAARRLLGSILAKSRDQKLKESARTLLAAAPSPMTSRLTGAAEVSRQSPTAAAAHEKGIALFLAGKDEPAAAAFGAALAENPFDAQALASRAVVLERLGRLEEAESDCAKALALAAKGAAPFPPDFAPDVLSTRASVLLRRGRREAAAADLSEALKIAPSWWKKHKEAKKRLVELSR